MKIYPFFDEKIISPYTIWIGKALGYSCPGQMGGLNPIMYGFKFSIMTEDNKTKGIYGEVCWDEKNYDYSKIKKMKSVATELNYRFFFDKSEKHWFNKLHTMTLKKEYFYQIARGEKKIELRLYDEKRKKINKNDIIEFKCGQESFRIGIKDIKFFDTFFQGLKTLTLKKTLPGISTYKEGVEIYHSISDYKEKEKNTASAL